MSYFPDLTPYTYTPNDKKANVQSLNVGWLDGQHPFSTGETAEGFQERLLEFCFFDHTVHHFFGIHICEICDDIASANQIRRGDKEASMGNGEIRVIGKSAIYAAPTMIYHYVVTHNYKPPDEFIEAVLTGPSPGSEEHRALVQKLGL